MENVEDPPADANGSILKTFHTQSILCIVPEII